MSGVFYYVVGYVYSHALHTCVEAQHIDPVFKILGEDAHMGV